eukprot:TRINITY_DN7014_c0_g6_i3.p3 TRINITY_DN7014_c0_g6~~TRINITY_DN7014_c0_g6_i3.p3  ORF type:complete len:181 (+),score=58.90 TRINITY_DN7014_c0_g6_i3:977-1519(+)
MEYKKKVIRPDPVKEHKRLRILVVGDSGVGKTSIANRLSSKTFDSKYTPTIGSDFYNGSVMVKGEEVKLNIFDMSGQAEFAEVRSEFYKEAQALVVVFDTTARGSFDALDAWPREANKYGGENVPVWIAGNKTDIDHRREVEKSKASDWAKSRKFNGYFEVSASTGAGINELFVNIASKI